VNDNDRSVFAPLIEPPKPEQLEPDIVRKGPQPRIPLAHHRSAPSEQLLSWLINCWPKDIITLRDIRAYGPNCARDPTDAVNLTKTLTDYGWLTPEAAWRRDMQKWRVVREPGKQRPAAQV
jgi:hypothetical protein